MQIVLTKRVKMFPIFYNIVFLLPYYTCSCGIFDQSAIRLYKVKGSVIEYAVS